MTASTRHRARESALQILFQLELNELTEAQALNAYWNHVAKEQSHDEFADALVRGTLAERARIDEILRSVSAHWRLERMPHVDRCILRLGVYELVWAKDVPAAVVLNEAIELAKRFGSEHSAAFVNGVLDRVSGQFRDESATPAGTSEGKPSPEGGQS